MDASWVASAALMLASASLFLLVTLVLSLVPIQPQKTLSQHIQLSPRLIRLAQILLPLASVGLLAWVLMAQFSLILSALLLMIALALVVMGVVTYGQSTTRDQIHNIAAWGSIPAILVTELILLSQYGSELAGILLPVLVAQTVLISIRIIGTKKLRNQMTLFGQLIYFAGFVLVLLAVETIRHA